MCQRPPTPSYGAAPEVFRHEFYGPAVDVYAASMIFYQLFCFQQPFYGGVVVV